MYGHVETPEHWVNQLLLVPRNSAAKLAASPNLFRSDSFIRTLCSSTRESRAPAQRSAEHLKIHALARFMLAGAINNIQVSWVKLNRGLSQLCLHAGANDYGGTLMEENISREAGATAGQYTSPEDFQALILETGRIPAERNTVYTTNQSQAAARSNSSPSNRSNRSSHDQGFMNAARPIAILGGTGAGRLRPGFALGPGRRNCDHRIARRQTRSGSRRQNQAESRRQLPKFPAKKTSPPAVPPI